MNAVQHKNTMPIFSIINADSDGVSVAVFLRATQNDYFVVTTDEEDQKKLNDVLLKEKAMIYEFSKAFPAEWVGGNLGDVFLFRGKQYLSFNNTKLQGEWADHAAWEFRINNRMEMEGIPVNRFVETTVSKASGLKHLYTTCDFPIVSVLLPFANDGYDGCTIYVECNKSVGCRSNFEFSDTNIDVNIFKSITFPKMKISNSILKVDGLNTLEVTLVNTLGDLVEKDTTAYIECTAGYLPRTVIPIVSGRGHFKYRALDLSVGETVKIKVGWSLFRGEDALETILG